MGSTKVKQMNINQIRFFWTLVSLIVIATFLYVYFVNTMIFNTARRHNIEEMIVDAKSEVSELEFAFITKKREITKEYAYSIGFEDLERVVFVDSADSLSFNEI